MIARKLFYIAQLPDLSVDGDTIETGLCNFEGNRRTFVRLHWGVEIRTFKLCGMFL